MVAMSDAATQDDYTTKGRVLVVDDDASLAEMLTIVLRQEGFDSRMCLRGDEAVEAFRDYKPDVVLLDLMLPGRDGIDVCKEIRTESGVPIVMLTAKGDTVDVVVGLESGADDYVVKPFKPKELVARIRARVRRFDATADGGGGFTGCRIAEFVEREGWRLDLDVDTIEERSGDLAAVFTHLHG